MSKTESVTEVLLIECQTLKKDSMFVQAITNGLHEELAIPMVDDWLQVVLVVSVDSKGSEDVLKNLQELVKVTP